MAKAVISWALDRRGQHSVTVDKVRVGTAWYMRCTNEWFFELDYDYIPPGIYSELHSDANAVRKFAVLCYKEARSKNHDESGNQTTN